MPSAGPHLGRVTSFDQRRGLGTVTEQDGGIEYPFHATAITDGSRTIAEQTAVTFTVGPGYGGRYEAKTIVPDAAAP
jgi:cold shock CspA family protein